MEEINGMRKITIIIIMLSIVFLFGSCQKSDNSSNQPSKKAAAKNTVLTLTYAGGDSSWNQTIDTVARDFTKKHPNISIEFSTGTASSDIYADYLKKKDAVGELGDIVEITDVLQYAKNGRIVPIPKEVTSLVNTCSEYNGRIYAVTAISSTQGIIYNKKIFRQLGLEEPKTYGEFLSICDRIKKYKLTPIIVGGRDLWHMGFWINHFFRNDVLLKDPDWQEERSAGLVSWTDEEPRQMLKHIMEIFNDGYVNRDYKSTPDSSTASAIAYGQAVMLYSGPWMFSQIMNLNPDAELGWFYLPDEKGRLLTLDSNPAGWAITADCAGDKDKYEAAVQFLKYFYSRQVYTQVCENMNAMPSTRKEIVYDAIPVQKKLLEDFNKSNNYTGKGIGDEETPEGFINYMYQLILELIDGKYTIGHVLKLLDTKWDK